MAKHVVGQPSRRSEGGFTLVEILIVLAVLAIMAAVVVPNVTGFLNRSKESAYKEDQAILQAAVNGWRSDPANAATTNGFPTLSTTNNTISLTALYNGNFITGLDVVTSANTTAMTGATNSPTGSYTWGINTSTGVVTSTPSYTAGTYP